MSTETSFTNPPPLTKIQIHIRKDKTVLADLMPISLSQLKLDPNNVRFKHIEEPMTDEEIAKYIWNENDTKSLLREIKFSEGLSEPPIVKKISDSEYLVIEGNRRTVCLNHWAEEIRSRKEKNITMEKIDPVQCVVLPPDIDEASIALYLARQHVSGKKEWRALNQAAHVYDLINKYDYDWLDVSHAISMGKNTINLNLKAFQITLDYHKKYPEDQDWLNRFSHFLELYKRRTLKEWAENPKNIEKFMEWVNNGKIPMAIHVRKLDKILLENKSAYKALQKGATILEAEEKIKDTEKDTTASISENADNQLQEMFDFVRNFPRSKMQELAKNPEKLGNLEDFYKECGRLIKDIKVIGTN